MKRYLLKIVQRKDRTDEHYKGHLGFYVAWGLAETAGRGSKEEMEEKRDYLRSIKSIWAQFSFMVIEEDRCERELQEYWDMVLLDPMIEDYGTDGPDEKDFYYDPSEGEGL